MYCLKCGKETQENQVFCPDCLKDMADNPVKPGTPVVLPSRSAIEKRAIQKKKQLTPEERILQLQMRLKQLRVLAGILALALCVALAAAFYLHHRQAEEAAPGQNYSIVSPTEPT